VGVANYEIPAIIVLPDDTILAGCYRNSDHDFFVRRFDTSGATLVTYSIGAGTGANVLPRIAFSPADAQHFYAWWHPTAERSRFHRIVISDAP
jgi:hypothetical protein